MSKDSPETFHKGETVYFELPYNPLTEREEEVVRLFKREIVSTLSPRESALLKNCATFHGHRIREISDNKSVIIFTATITQSFERPCNHKTQ